LTVDSYRSADGKGRIPARRHALRSLSIVLVFLAHGCGQDGAGANARSSEQLYRECISCHAMAPGRHLIGPSLAGIWGRKAGTAKGFDRYSDALKSSGIVWSTKTMDGWLANPQALVPGNQMMFKGVRNRRVRQELIAILKKETAISPGGNGPLQTGR